MKSCFNGVLDFLNRKISAYDDFIDIDDFEVSAFIFT